MQFLTYYNINLLLNIKNYKKDNQDLFYFSFIFLYNKKDTLCKFHPYILKNLKKHKRKLYLHQNGQLQQKINQSFQKFCLQLKFIYFIKKFINYNTFF